MFFRSDRSLSSSAVSAAPLHQTGSHRPAGNEGFPLFDWLRMILASLVALGHEGMPALGPIDANLAVIVFLALSGWLIGGILLALPMRELPRFFYNRATRIWLPYALAIGLIYGLAAVREGIDLYWLKYLFYDVTFTHFTFTHFPQASHELPMDGTGNHFWSLSVEEQFYLAAPLLMFLLPFGKKLWVWVLVAAGLLALGSIFSAIALGVLAAVVQRDYPGWFDRTEMRLLVWCGTIAAFALTWTHDMPQLRAVFSVLLVQSLALPGRRGAVGAFIGAISYPFYLNHWIGAFLVNGIAKHLPAMPAAVLIGCAYVVAVLAGVVTWLVL